MKKVPDILCLLHINSLFLYTGDAKRADAKKRSMLHLIITAILIFVSAPAIAQNVGIGTTSPQARLHIHATESPQLIISGSDGPTKPGIQFKNNSIHYISGDDLSEETFGFYSKFSNQRTYGTTLQVYGPAASSWGTYVGLKHDGSKGFLYTDAGDLIFLQGVIRNSGLVLICPNDW
jgi:hypothetical protein